MTDLDDGMSGWVPMANGIRRRTLVHGAGMMQMLVRLEAGSLLPEHRHPHEQISHVLAGRLRFWVAGECREVSAGESVYLDPDVSHAVEALEATLVLDTFSPPREDLLAQDERMKASGRTP